MWGLISDFGIGMALVTVSLVSMALEVPGPFKAMLTTFQQFLPMGWVCLLFGKIALRVIFPFFIEYPHVPRPDSKFPSLRVSRWLLSPQHTIASYGFVVLLSAVLALLQDPEQLPVAHQLALFPLLVLSIMIFGLWQLQEATKHPSRTRSFLLGTSPHVLQQLLWLIAACVIAVLILSIGAMFGWPLGLIDVL